MGTWGERLSAHSEVPSQPGESEPLQHPRVPLSRAISELSEVFVAFGSHYQLSTQGA